jgi:predicted PurR-regulated permease PerM
MNGNTVDFSKNAIDAAIKVSIAGVLIYWCYSILSPFILIVVWGAIIGTALYPLVKLLSVKLKLSQGKASALLTLSGILLIVVPTYYITGGLFSGVQEIYDSIVNHTFSLPPPAKSIQDWPLIGSKLYSFLLLISSNIAQALVTYNDQIIAVLGAMVGTVGSIGGSILQFVISMIIAGVLMANAPACEKVFHQISIRLAGDYGASFTKLSVTTVRGVVQGVIGVAIIQSIMAGIGAYFAGIPMVGLWMFAVLFVAIIQLPPILALIPAIIMAYSGDSSTVATVFLVWCLLVSASDAILKPMLMGRGSDVPMLVILLGAIGGMAMSGIVGLFVGAVVLALTYTLFLAWLDQTEEIANDETLEE